MDERSSPSTIPVHESDPRPAPNPRKATSAAARQSHESQRVRTGERASGTHDLKGHDCHVSNTA